MGFLSDFAEGFFTTSAQTLDRRSQLREQEDLDRKKRLNELNAQKVLLEHKARIEAEAEDRKLKALQTQREAYGFGEMLKNTSTPGKVDVPETVDPIELEQKFTSNAAKAALYGDDAAYKALNAQADVYKLEREKKKQARTEGREGVTSVEGLKPAEELYKEDTEMLAKPEIDSSLYYKYFGEARALSPNDEGDLETISSLKDSVTQAAKLTHVLTSVTADERGISDKGAGELKADAVNMVRLKNQYLATEDEQEKEAVLAAIVDIADNYPAAENLLLDMVGLPASAFQDQEAAPVELTTTSSAGGGAQPSEIRNVSTQEEYNALPSGTVFIDPEGNRRRKP